MPHNAAAKKAGSSEPGDGATVRCHHGSNSPIHVVASYCLEARDLSGRSSSHSHEVFHKQSFGKLANFLDEVERFPEIVESFSRCSGPPAVSY